MAITAMVYNASLANQHVRGSTTTGGLAPATTPRLHGLCRNTRVPVFRGPDASRSKRVVRASIGVKPASPTVSPANTTRVPAPRVRPAPAPYDPSGQPGTDAYGAPLRGRPEPPGATVDQQTSGVNFSLFSANAATVSLVLFWEDDLRAGRSTFEIPLDPLLNKTGDMWHVLLPNANDYLLYGYRVTGLHQDSAVVAAAENIASVEGEEAPFIEEVNVEGHRFSEGSVVLDPYAQGVVGRRHWGELGPDLPYGQPGVLGVARTWPQCAGSLPRVSSTFDWEGDRPLGLPMESMVVYEMHVRGFTQDDTSGVRSTGTYAGLVERLDYLQDLGINAIELLPVHEFNELEYYQIIPGTDEYRHNFWGYSTVNYFAPMSRYSQAAKEGGGGEDVVNEFKQMVKECHKRGIEVILDVVFNHTAEGNEQGPTISFRGLDNRVYYMLAPQGQYYNYSGCGNTFNCNHPVVRRFILDCLRYWVEEMHVDGFRFDLASIMTRAHSMWHQQMPDEEGEPTGPHSAGAVVNHDGIMTDGAGVPTGTPLADPPLVQMISEDPVLAGTKLIAEAWDCDGLNQVGAFPHYDGRWAEWNGQFRDNVRQFIKGTDGNFTSLFASAMCGSPDLYLNSEPHESDWWATNGGRKWKGGRGPQHSVNFITAHDGFTLADLVSYNEKHNEANGEENRDGESHNLSWNCGEEGPTDNPAVTLLRERQMRNFACALLLAQGVPMILMGDEYGHTKGGNNNTYCHDTRLNYFDWEHMHAQSTGYGRFFRHLVHFRRDRDELGRGWYPSGGDIKWHGALPDEPDWGETSRFLAFTLGSSKPEGGGLYVAFNTGHVPVTAQLPFWGDRVWQVVADTGKPAPYDFLMADDALSQREVEAQRGLSSHWMQMGMCCVLPWSVVILESVPYSPPPTQLSGVPAQRRYTASPGPPMGPAPTVPRTFNVQPGAPNGGPSYVGGVAAPAASAEAAVGSDHQQHDQHHGYQQHAAAAGGNSNGNGTTMGDLKALEQALAENERLRQTLGAKMRAKGQALGRQAAASFAQGA